MSEDDLSKFLIIDPKDKLVSFEERPRSKVTGKSIVDILSNEVRTVKFFQSEALEFASDDVIYSEFDVLEEEEGYVFKFRSDPKSRFFVGRSLILPWGHDCIEAPNTSGIFYRNDIEFMGLIRFNELGKTVSEIENGDLE